MTLEEFRSLMVKALDPHVAPGDRVTALAKYVEEFERGGPVRAAPVLDFSKIPDEQLASLERIVDEAEAQSAEVFADAELAAFERRLGDPDEPANPDAVEPGGGA